MKDISNLQVAQIRLYPVDIIPFHMLITNSEKLQKSWNFKGLAHGVDPEGNITTLRFTDGQMKYNNGFATINTLLIMSRKTVLHIFGNSELADTIYRKLIAELSEYDENKMLENTEPLIKTQETTCVVTLGFSFRDIFSERVNSFLSNELKDKTSNQYSENIVFPAKFQVSVRYKPISDELLMHNIALVDKEFVLEPREKTPLEEQRFFTKSPTDSKTHLELIESFEKLFVKERASRRKAAK